MVAFLTGQRITADRLNAMQPSIYYKSGSTSRNTTTTYAIDPDLQGIPLAVGTYKVSLLLLWNCGSGTAPGLKTQWRVGGGGAWNSFNRAVTGPGQSNATSPTVMTQVNDSTAADNADSTYQQTPNVPYAVVREEVRQLIVTTAGTLNLYWAQVVSSAANTTVQPGSAFEVQQLF